MTLIDFRNPELLAIFQKVQRDFLSFLTNEPSSSPISHLLSVADAKVGIMGVGYGSSNVSAADVGIRLYTRRSVPASTFKKSFQNHKVFQIPCSPFRLQGSCGGYIVSSVGDGTLGCTGKVQGQGDTQFLLSCYHVLAGSDPIVVGAPIFDGSVRDADGNLLKIGELFSGEQPVPNSKLPAGSEGNQMDAALARLRSVVPPCTPGNQVAATRMSAEVQKMGATTLHTSGSIEEITLSFHNDDLDPITFVDQVGVQSQNGTFSAAGDSGSLVMTNDVQKNAVGMVIAGAFDKNLLPISVVTPIDRIKQKLNFSIA